MVAKSLLYPAGVIAGVADRHSGGIAAWLSSIQNGHAREPALTLPRWQPVCAGGRHRAADHYLVWSGLVLKSAHLRHDGILSGPGQRFDRHA